MAVVSLQESVFGRCVIELTLNGIRYPNVTLKLDSNKTNLTAEGHRLDNFPVPSMPWRPCTNLCFFLAEY